jgi:protein-disulfide isomerase
MSQSPLPVDFLVWGHGPRIFEAFLEPTCPYSARVFGKLDQLLADAGEDRITVKLRLHSQPWHMYSPVVTRCVIAASTLPDGKEAARAVLAAVYAHREDFEFDRHATGPNRDATPNDLIRRIEGLTGLELMAAFDRPDLDKVTRWHTRYARQNGIHVSPSFMIDGIVQADMSSGDAVADWVKRLG